MSAVNSCCSDLREINEAKVHNILSYLDDVHTTAGGYYPSGRHFGSASPSPSISVNASTVMGGGFPLQEISEQLARKDNAGGASLMPMDMGKRSNAASYAQQHYYDPATYGAGGYANPNNSGLERPTLNQQTLNAVANGNKATPREQSPHPTPSAHGGGGGRAHSSSSYSTAALLMPISSENTQIYGGIKRKIDELKRSNDQLTAENSDLKAQLSGYTDKENARVAKVQDIARGEIEGMRFEQQRQQQQHMAMVNKLVREKEQLVIKCDDLATNVRLLQEAKTSEVRRLSDQHMAAVTELKGKWLVQEKAKREQWMVAESKRIKDNTLRAMEPDIALLMNRHKAEKARIQEECDLLIKKKDEQLAEKDQNVQDAKLKMGRDLESLVVKEREAFRVKMEEEGSRFRKELEEHRRQSEEKLAANNTFFEEQKQHYVSTIKSLESQLLSAKGFAAEKDATFHAAVSLEVQKLLAIKERELQQRKENFDDEVMSFKESLSRENAESMRRKEEEYKIIMRQERDAAIAKVVQKLEDEHVKEMSNQRETSSLARDKMTRQEREIGRLTLEKDVLEQQAAALVHQGKATNELVEKLQMEIQSLRDGQVTQHDTIERQFHHRLQGLDRMWQQKLTRFESEHNETIQQLQHEHTLENKNRVRRVEDLETDIRNLESKHNMELSSINDRVVAAMAKRDATVQMLQEQLRLAQQCIHEREAELERHRMLLES